MKTFVLSILVSSALMLMSNSSTHAAPGTSSWPKLKSFEITVPIDFRSKKTFLRVDLPDVNGKPVYKLVCFSGNESYSIALESGGLLCGLGMRNQPDKAVLENRTLLSGVDPGIHSRGNFNPEELVGSCAHYPDYGLERQFALRGFRLTLKIKGLEVSPDYRGGSAWRDSFDFYSDDRSKYPIGRAKLEVTVSPDPQALSQFAPESRFPDPKGVQENCSRSTGS